MRNGRRKYGLCLSGCLALLFVPLFTPRLHAEKYVSPQQPEGAPARKPATNQPKPPAVTLHVEVTLCDGRQTSGDVTVSADDPLTIKHTREGISYTKSVHLRDIHAIEIKKWKGHSVRETRDGLVYRFTPASYRIELAENTLDIQGDFFSFFQDFDLKNRNGSVRLFSYWMDLEKKDGTWYTGMTGPGNGYRILCHNDVVRKITIE